LLNVYRHTHTHTHTHLRTQYGAIYTDLRNYLFDAIKFTDKAY